MSTTEEAAELPAPGQPFDPRRYLTLISGKQYLEVKWRLLWLRTEHPHASIETELVRDDGASATFKATVTLPTGGSATGWGQESAQDFGDYLEKAETKALGRALAALGFGTQFCADHEFGAESGRIVDSPVNGHQHARRQAGTPDPATERQIKAIYAIGRAGHLSEADVALRSQNHFGASPEQLSRKDASDLIDLLKHEIAEASAAGRAKP